MKSKHSAPLVAVAALAALALSPLSDSQATSLSLGADYLLRGVSIEEREKTLPKNDYYDQRLQAYLITDLSQDVEATLRVQSITPWGLENSTTSLLTRYPDANGDFWIQNAFVRLPNIWNKRIILTVGRQPLQWGEGLILSDDELGFNAIRAQIKSPWERFEFDIDAFQAKIAETLQAGADTDLTGALLGYDRNLVRWEFMGLWEESDSPQSYEMGADTGPVTATKIERRIFGVRARMNLKDAYLKGAYFVQGGSVRRAPAKADIKLGGSAYMIGLGGTANTKKIGRFGAFLELAVGEGDKVGTPGEDEAFRPTFASRWSGLERKGYGRYFASTFSDVYSSTNPFAPVTSVNDGLPAGTSGIQTARFGIESTPWAKWSFLFDFYQYKAQKNLAGKKDLGSEFDYGVVYRYSGLVTVRGTMSIFYPGDAYPENSRQRANWNSIEIELKF